MVLYVHCSFAIILIGKRELVALLSLSSWCLLVVIWLFLAVPWVCLQFAIVVLPVHTHLLFFCNYFVEEELWLYFSSAFSVLWLYLFLISGSHQRRMPRFKSASKASSFLFTFPKISRSPK